MNEKKDEIYNELLGLQSSKGYLTPQMIVESAIDETSPLHNQFDWNDETASQKYRLWQARSLVNKYRIVIQGKDVEAFHSVRVIIEDKEQNVYMHTPKIMTDKDMQSQILATALSELTYWQNKYQTIQELTGVVNQKKVQKLQQKVSL